MIKEIKTGSEEETGIFAENFARGLQTGTVIALHGDLGAGKTVFARGFARGLGITENVLSPTYTIIQEYKLKNGRWFYHLDLYRIKDSNSALAFGADEYIQSPLAISLIEWAERVPELLPPDAIHIEITHISQNERGIEVNQSQVLRQ